MSHKAIFILVEGDDDERFVQGVITPKLTERYDTVITWKYAGRPAKKINGFIRSINAMGAEYVCLADINGKVCITEKKNWLSTKITGLDPQKIIVVVKEIEGWYLAGMDATAFRKLKAHAYKPTDSLTKEQFDALIPASYLSRVDFMREILKLFSFPVATAGNRSFKYFANKLSLS